MKYIIVAFSVAKNTGERPAPLERPLMTCYGPFDDADSASHWGHEMSGFLQPAFGAWFVAQLEEPR